jgi:hypothetical protein
LPTRKLARNGGDYQQKETCWLEMAVTLNCSFATTDEAPAMPNINEAPAVPNVRKNCQATFQRFFFANQLQTLEVSWQFAVSGVFLVGKKKVVGEFFGVPISRTLR